MERLGRADLAGAFILTGVIRTPHAVRNRRNVVVGTHAGRKDKPLLVAMFLAMMILPLVHLATGAFDFADYVLPTWSTAVGAALQFPALWLFWRSHADLGHNWSPCLEIRREHDLVTTGIYARIRHPMYASIWLSVFSQSLLLPNWIAGFLAIPAFAAMWLLRVSEEEAMMRLRFGEAYNAYAAHTGRLFPR